MNAIRKTAGSNTVASVLLRARGADSIAIVSAKKYDRSLECCCEIHPSVRIAFRCRPLAEIANNYAFLTTHFIMISRPWRLGNLRSQWATYCVEVECCRSIMDRHLTPLARLVHV